MRVTVGALLEEASSGVTVWGGRPVRESEREAMRAGETVPGGGEEGPDEGGQLEWRKRTAWITEVGRWGGRMEAKLNFKF